MKTFKRLKITAILLFVAILIFASFLGVYKKEDFRAVNIIKDYKLGMQFTDKLLLTGTVGDGTKGIIEYDYAPDDTEENESETLNDEQEYTIEDYKLTKKIIIKRLKEMSVGEYKINLDEKTGTIKIWVQNNDNAHEVAEHAIQKGEFTIIDKDTQDVLLTNSDVKSTKVVYGASRTDTSATVIYLQINFNKEGAKKLEEISQIYVAGTEKKENKEEQEEALEEETDETDSTKYISVLLDDETLSSTYFGEKMSTGVLYIPITQASDSETLTTYIKEVNNISAIINSGALPVEYSFSEKQEEANLSYKNIAIGIVIPAAILLIACIVLIVKFKIKGLVSMFLQIGYIALVLLALRYTNVIITIQGIVGIVIFAYINYAFNYLLLRNLKENEKVQWKLVGKFALYTSPIYAIAIILAFNSLTVINSLGMATVWGSFSLYIYNLSITKTVLEMLNK